MKQRWDRTFAIKLSVNNAGYTKRSINNGRCPTSRFSGGFDDSCPSIRSLLLAPLILVVGRTKNNMIKAIKIVAWVIGVSMIILFVGNVLIYSFMYIDIHNYGTKRCIGLLGTPIILTYSNEDEQISKWVKILRVRSGEKWVLVGGNPIIGRGCLLGNGGRHHQMARLAYEMKDEYPAASRYVIKRIDQISPPINRDTYNDIDLMINRIMDGTETDNDKNDGAQQVDSAEASTIAVPPSIPSGSPPMAFTSPVRSDQKAQASLVALIALACVAAHI